MSGKIIGDDCAVEGALAARRMSIIAVKWPAFEQEVARRATADTAS